MRKPTRHRAAPTQPGIKPRTAVVRLRDHVCVGAVATAHGIRGEVKIKTFTTEPANVGAYGPLADETGARSFVLEAVRPIADDMVIARLQGIADRNAAEALRGLRLYAPRTALPAPEQGEYYHHDLIGLRAVLAGGEALGTVSAVHNFGAGDLLEVERAAGEPVVLPFTDAVVPAVDLAAGTVTVVLPEGLLDEAEPEGDRS